MLALIILLALALLLIIASYLTDPFSRYSLIKQPYTAHFFDTQFEARDQNHKLIVNQRWYFKWFAIIACGIHIMASRYVHSPRASSVTVDKIIQDIYQHRFRPDRLLVTSGDHFSALFVRNLGVFYYPLLDSRLSDSEQSWQNRQAVYVQSVAYALGVFSKYPVPHTTIVPTGSYRATCVNFYAYPSDTVYGLLYALNALLGNELAAPWDYTKSQHDIATTAVTKQLLADYGGTLRRLYDHYRQHVFDAGSGLIKRDQHLSGAKDITRRHGAFYDNVIFWKTTALAMELDIIDQDRMFLRQLKRRILKTYWLEDKGYFLEDLSDAGMSHAYYSSDWLIVLATGFLDPMKRSERHYFERSVTYIQQQGIDRPFAIKYQHETRAQRQFLAVRLAVASYGGDAIWSFWGMEYIKLLMMLYLATGNTTYLHAADHHIAAYERAMVRDSGFPEVYDKQGKLLQTLFYRSVRQTGWVVGFDQVQAMRRALKTQGGNP